MKLWEIFADTQDFQDLPGALRNEAAVDTKNLDAKYGQPYVKLGQIQYCVKYMYLKKVCHTDHVEGEVNEDEEAGSIKEDISLLC